MKLYLVQHGEAVSKKKDPDRPLSTQGRSDVHHLAAFIKSVGIKVRAVYHSGKRRAEETAQLLVEVQPEANQPEVICGIAPNDDVAIFARQVAEWNEDSMVIGHLPFMARLVAKLIGIQDDGKSIAFLPGSIVCLERDQSGAWQLQFMMRPESLR